MNSRKFYEIEDTIQKAVHILDRLSPSGEAEGDYEEGIYQLEKAKECFRFMSASLDDVICEAKVAKKALDTVGDKIQEKLDNPYRQVEFVSFKNNPFMSSHLNSSF